MKTKKLPNDWQEFLSIDYTYKFTQAFLDWAQKKDIFCSKPGILNIYYKGDPETTTEWICVTDDGSYYKVGAQYMVWSNTYVRACWSGTSLEKTVEAFFKGVNAPADPDYQT